VNNSSQLITTGLFDWSRLGTDGTAAGPRFGGLSTNVSGTGMGEYINGYLASGEGTILTAGTDAPASGGISAGDSILSVSDGPTSGGSVSINMAPAFGVGAYVDAGGGSQFTAEIQVFSGINSVLDMTVTSDLAGDAIFLGAQDSTQDITRVVYSLTSVASGLASSFNLDMINIQNVAGSGIKAQLAPVVPVQPAIASPEPGVIGLVGFGLLALVFKKRSTSFVA
jgi:hypothetical protein